MVDAKNRSNPKIMQFSLYFSIVTRISSDQSYEPVNLIQFTTVPTSRTSF